MIGLFRQLEEYGDEIEADLLRYYGIDLLDFYRGTLSGRRLRILLRHMPYDSALVRKMNGGRPGWGLTDHLLADLWRVIIQVNSQDPAKVDDHPVRAEMITQAALREKNERLGALKSRFRRLKSRYYNTSGGGSGA